MHTGTECNLLPVNAYKRISGDQHFNSLYAQCKSALISANGEEHPTKGKATLFASRKGQKHQIEVNVVKGGGCEPILSKQTMLDMNLIQILDGDHLSVNAIADMPDLTDAQSLRRFLGLENYLAIFLSRLSEETDVLGKLTEKDAQWCRRPAHADAVARVKEMIVSAPVLAYYDATGLVVNQSDASQSGIGAALLQEGRPVAFSSRVMPQTEQNYAGIEKELLATVLPVKNLSSISLEEVM